MLTLSRALLQATPPATPDPPPPVAAVQQAGFGIALNSPNNPCSRGAPTTAQRPATPPSALANSLRSSPSPPRETEAQVATPNSGQAVSAEELAKQTARRVKVLLCPLFGLPCLRTPWQWACIGALDFKARESMEPSARSGLRKR